MSGDYDRMEDEGELMQSLNKQQVEMAQMFVSELHPISETPISTSFPWLCGWVYYARRCCGWERRPKKVYDDTEFAGKHLTKEQKKMKRLRERKKIQDAQKQIDDDGKDPYLSLGYGLIAYRKTLFAMSMAYVLFSLFAYPIIQTYHESNAIHDSVSTRYGRYSIANLGYSSVQCGTIPFGMAKMVLSCPYGNITSMVVNGTGINSMNSNNRDACIIDNSQFSNSKCSGYLKEDLIKTQFDQHCLGERTCTFDFSNRWDYLQGADKNTPNDECYSIQSQVFIQYTCEITLEEQAVKYNKIALVSSIILFISFSYSIIIYYL